MTNPPSRPIGPNDRPPTKTIMLKCPTCKRIKRVKREPHDPKRAKTVSVKCDRCDNGGEFHN